MSRLLGRIAGMGLLLFSVATFLAVATLAVVHVDDRYGVSAASGVWMGLTAAVRAGAWYPPPYLHGFYGGTRYMPLPIVFELVGRQATGEYLVSAKVLIYAVNVVLYGLVYLVARRRGAPKDVSLVIVAVLLASSAASSTLLGIRWDALATLFQLLAVALVADRPTRNRAVIAGILCALAVATKVTALWAPAAITVWLLWRSPRRFVNFGLALAAATGLLFGVFEALTHGRLLRQAREFTFAGSGHSSLSEGAHRFYQLALRNERSLPLLLAVAVLVLLVSLVGRRVGLFELCLLFEVPIVVVVMRDFGTYENHLIDLEVLAGLVVAGVWTTALHARWLRVARLCVVLCLLAAAALADRYTLIPDFRSAASHELRGRSDPRYSLHPVPQLVRMGSCVLFEDASIPILAGRRPVVLDAFITHRLQTQDRPALMLLERRIDTGAFKAIVLNFPLTDAGWFATLDFGTALADAMRANYRLSRVVSAARLYIYVPRRLPAVRRPCRVASLSSFG
jgi:hypothetical protein